MVACDPSESVAFEGGFAIHPRTHFARLTGIDEDDIVQKSNKLNFTSKRTTWMRSSGGSEGWSL